MVNGAACDSGSGVERGLLLVSFSRWSRLNPLISFPEDYQELVCALPSPVSWASSARFKTGFWKLRGIDG